MSQSEKSIVKVDNPVFDELLRQDGEYFARRVSDEGVDVAHVKETQEGTYQVSFPNGDSTEIPDPSVFFKEDPSTEKRVQFVAPKLLVDVFDYIADDMGVSRSHLLREAMLSKMEDERDVDAICIEQFHTTRNKIYDTLHP